MKEVRPRDGGLESRLDVGDRIIVYELTGRVIDMRFVVIDGDILRGSLTADGQQPVEVRLADIEKIESERVAVGRTAGLVLGGVVLAPVAAVAAGAALADSLR